MRILFFGTPQFAVPSFTAVLDFVTAHAAQDSSVLLGAVTQPDKPSGRGHKLTAGAVATLARAHGIPVYQPQTLQDPHLWDTWRRLSPDLFVVVAYGRLLPRELLAIPKLGSINLHASLLPAYRGAAPIQRALMAGDRETGVTTMQVVYALDAGDILRQRTLAILESDTTATLAERLSVMGAETLYETLEDYQMGRQTPIAQDTSQVTLAPPLSKEEGLIDWNRPARDIHNQSRGVTPWPGARARLKGLQVKLLSTALTADSEITAAPGTIVHLSAAAIEVACNPGVLAIKTLQLENKRPLSVRDFLNGFPLSLSDRFEAGVLP